MLSQPQRDEFEQCGVVRLRGAFGEADAARMRERLWKALSDEWGIQPGRPETWSVRQPTGLQPLRRSSVFEALGSPVLAAALDDLLGAGCWRAPKRWGSPLVTFPSGSHWDVPSKQWHLDIPARGAARPLFLVRILALLDRLEPRGGGTLVVVGSHALVERLVAAGANTRHSKDVLRALARMSPWLRDLCSDASGDDRIRRFMVEAAVVGDVVTRVVELTGEAGDVFLMHPWQLHGPSPNCGTSPRLMLSESILRSRG